MNGWLRGTASLFLLALALQSSTGLGSGAGSQTATDITLDPAIECWYHDEFPQLDAAFVPAVDIERTRLYFRCTLFSDYYFVDLEPLGANYRAVAPKAQEDCPEVSYYVEVLRSDFTSDRSLERTAQVTSHTECRRRFPAAALFTGDPRLTVGSTGQSLTSLAGFKMDGVSSLVSASGQVAAGSGGGGLSGPAVAGIVAGAGGAAVLGATAGGGDDPPSSGGDGPTGSATTSSTTTTTATTAPPPGPGPAPVEACIEVDPMDATIRAGQQIQLDARCSTGDGLSFEWDLGDGRIREGAFITPRYPSPGSFEVTLTVTQPSSGLRSTRRLGRSSGGLLDVVDTASLRVTVLEELRACFSYSDNSPGSGCTVVYNAECSRGDIVRYEWLLDVTNVNGSGPFPDSGPEVTHDWFGTGACSFSVPSAIQVRLTVFDASGASDSTQRSTDVIYFTSPHRSTASVATSFTSYLGVPPFDGGVSGQVSLDGQQVDLVTNQSPAQHRQQGRIGRNAIEAYTTAPVSSPGYWRFDFRGASNFVAGSIEVQSGQVLSRDAATVVFRVSEEPGQRIRFTYQLVP